ncbi:uncharacterized protein [Clytia hemisphaerica]|uniref:Glutamine amidotransferase domain-containing protein n=1 Tax=Clytia hemisphaerica TaxID=252671 RepID=A0A7M5XBI6_9CNID
MNIKKIGVIIVEENPVIGGSKEWWQKHFQPRFNEFKYISQMEVLYEPLFVTENPSILGQIPLEDYAGFVITGSSHSVNKDTVWISELKKFVRKVFESGKGKIFGICFGHQLIGKAFGCTIGNCDYDGHIFGGEMVNVTKECQDMKAYKNCFGDQDSFLIFEAHGEEIQDLSREDFEVLGSSKTCKYELVRWSSNIVSIQGHPDFSEAFVQESVPDLMQLGFINEKKVRHFEETYTDVDRKKIFKMVVLFLISD